MAVDGVLQLVADVVQAVEDRAPLLLREVERFAHLVGKKGVVADVAPQLRTAQQIGVEEERPAFGLAQLPVVLRAEDLSGCETDERSFLIVVGLAAVDHVAALHVFEEDGIDAEGAQRGADGSHFREVDDADERMQRLAAQRVVVVEDVVYSYDVVHHSVRI